MSDWRQLVIEDRDCRVYWGSAGCHAERGHGGSHRHRDGKEVDMGAAFLFGEDLTEAELEERREIWGE